MIPLKSGSGWVIAAHYDAANEDLYVQYKRMVCRYSGVPKQMYTDLVNAPSAGTYIHESGLYSWPYTPVSIEDVPSDIPTTIPEIGE